MRNQGGRQRFWMALSITLGLHAFVLVLMSFQSVRQEAADSAEYVAVDFLDEAKVDLIKEQTLESILQERLNERVANLAANEQSELSQSRVSSSGATNDEDISKAVEAELRALEQEEFERLAAEKKDFGLEGVPDDGAEGTVQTLTEWDKRYDGQVTVSYDLSGRMHRNLPVPGYKCQVAGSVSISIKVAANGRVINAKVASVQLAASTGMSGASAGLNDCIARAALMSAEASQFEAIQGDVASGQLNYRFLAQD
jgi:hypothetical protein